MNATPLDAIASRRPQCRRAGARAFSRLRVSSASSRRSCIRPRSSSTCPGEAIRGRLFLTAGRGGRGALPQARIYHPRLPRLSRLGQSRRGRRIFLSRAGLPRAGRGRRRTRPDRPRKLWPQGRRSGRRRDLLAGDGGGRRGGRKARGAARRRRPVRRASHGARPARRLAPAPEARAGARPRSRAPSSTGAARARSRSRACWRRWKAPTTRAPARWSRTCWRSPASTRSADARRARSPTGSSSRRRSARATRSASRQRQVLASYLAVSGDPDVAADKLRDLARVGRARPRPGARRLRAAQRLHRRARRRDRGDPLFAPPSCATSTITPASCSRRATRRGPTRGQRSPAAATTALRASSGRARTFPRSARRLRSTGSGREGAR